MPATPGEPRPPEVVRSERRTMAAAGIIAALLVVFAVRYATNGHWVSAVVCTAISAANVALVVTLARRRSGPATAGRRRSG